MYNVPQSLGPPTTSLTPLELARYQVLHRVQCVFAYQTESADDVHAMMRSCWEMNAVQRPSFSELVHWLYRRLRPMMPDSLSTNTVGSSRNIIDHCQSMSGDRYLTNE